jgi:NAD(P)-dependent dehydrogenase (short-subunit alcohol dehydrogenase family)
VPIADIPVAADQAFGVVGLVALIDAATYTIMAGDSAMAGSDSSARPARIENVRRLVDPKYIAALAVFLASDVAKSISGQMLPIDNDMQSAS